MGKKIKEKKDPVFREGSKKFNWRTCDGMGLEKKERDL